MDEVNGTTGVAHVLEHMMFKGTKTLKPGEFSARVAALGGRENAFTSKDYTAYFQQIEKSRLGSVMALEADRMANLVFDKNEFAREIKVVMEERRWRTDDQPQQKVYEALNATAFEAHPYHHPIVGWMNDLQNMTVDDAKTWYDHWYGPNNATMVVTGDVDANQVHKLAEKYFGRIPRKPLPHTKPQQEPPQEGLNRVTVKAPAAGTTTEQLEKLLRAEVERIAREGVSEAELKRVKTQLIAGQIYKRDSIFGQAMEIGSMEMTGISYKLIDRIIEKAAAVTTQQVQAVAQKYFGTEALTIATLVPLPLTEKKAPPPAGLRH